MVYDENGDLCFEEQRWRYRREWSEELNKALLAILTWPVSPPMPILAEQAQHMIEQNRQLQVELDQSLLAHQNDAERAQQATKQRDVQFQSDFRVIQTEFAKRQAEWQETSHVEQEISEEAMCMEQWESDEQWKVADAKWEAMVKQLQDDFTMRQKEMEEEHAHRDMEMEKQRVLQEQRHAEQQQRLHAHAPLLPPPLPPPQHMTKMPPNVLPQAPVVDFAQQRVIAQIPLTKQENEV